MISMTIFYQFMGACCSTLGIAAIATGDRGRDLVLGLATTLLGLGIIVIVPFL